VVIGVDQSPWHEALDGTSVPVHYVTPDEPNPMREAVRKASEFAQGGDTVILAPASASMDQFTSYSDRGEQFSRAVRGLGGQRASS
ncbi:MAG: UDP-N-acetylmuramoyl-L-alanine--D-glutamate ligase, partial [Trueperella sp.]|nr:UDP-N-acetylmuramoyl-L-alanine--D-glutamate ligase [Trueperella sp.]